MGRWPELKLRRPKSLSELRVYATSEESITKYFDELETILEKYDLKLSPENIYNVDEKGISMTHAPPYVVGSTDEVPIEISPERSSTVTMIGCGNALGQQIPPYFIFPGARMRQELLEGATIGTNGTVMRNGIILFVLPPHTSHILQPMDVGCFGPFSKVFSDESRKWQRSHSGTLTRYNVCSIACRAYDISLTPRNLQSAFRKSGIYPFYPTAIDSSLLKPAQYAKKRRAEQSTETASNNADISQPQDRNTVNNFFSSHLPVVHHDKPNQSKPRRSAHKVVGGKPITEPAVSSQLYEYVSSSKKPKVVSSRKTKAVVPIKESNSPQPGLSGVDNGLISSDNFSESETEDDEKCCLSMMAAISKYELTWSLCVRLTSRTPNTRISEENRIHSP
ncbi:uncharacterized protein LOC121383505 [Gigantopelta aegis]|uniref:uncharacterized protein LOC121383505 n=1 Tax=Gigantopelta aegis TaxID=1735272 RepID=UPI001B88B60A|nr:uncharacterized protein LOC121383505 [Gigantopelta aegis]